MTKYLMAALFVGLLMGAGGYRQFGVKPAPVVAVVPGAVGATGDGRIFSETITGRGYFTQNGIVSVMLSDGRTLNAPSFRSGPAGWEAEIQPNLWVKGAM